MTRMLLVTVLLAVWSSCREKEPSYPFPEAAWELSTPDAEGIRESTLDSIHQDILRGDYGPVDHFLVIRHGKIIADHHYERDYKTIAQPYDTTNWIFNYDHPDWHPYYQYSDLHSLQSVTKSVNAAALGIAIDEGFVGGTGDRTEKYLGKFATDWNNPLRKSQRIADLLTMRSGIQWNEGQYTDSVNTCITMEASSAWVPYVLAQPMELQPGTYWEYNSGASMLIGQIITEATGRKVDEWTNEKLFKPIGINKYQWKTTPAGEVDTEGGLYLAPHDLARFGYLFLRKGKWKDRQIISKDWVTHSTAAVVSDILPDNKEYNYGYGFQWWVDTRQPATPMCIGYGGQFVQISPEHDLVVVFNGWNIHYNPVKFETRDALRTRIIPAVEKP
ncbi:MAG: beta-lactamase family protein [Cyclobacteriaceae bacterium]|nr:beta-lactamase family protein [Cyclobacteriaceae bacterium]